MEKKVSIVMATYHPNMQYLEEQLESIEKQTYRNIELLICDDCSPMGDFNKINYLANSILKNTSFQVFRNEVNLGSNRTFEKLTEMATGEYIAFSDQDDVFDTDKLQILIDLLEKDHSVLAYSDARVIGANGELINNSFKNHNGRIQHVFGENQTANLIRRNSVTGCTMLIRNQVAKQALPFPDYKIYVHDHWLTLIASTLGKMAYSEKPLISYRLHGNNQIGSAFLKKVNDKLGYLNNKLVLEKERYVFLLDQKHYFNEVQLAEIEAFLKDVEARMAFFQKTNVKNLASFIRNRKIDWPLFLFELSLCISPKFGQKKILETVKKKN